MERFFSNAMIGRSATDETTSGSRLYLFYGQGYQVTGGAVFEVLCEMVWHCTSDRMSTKILLQMKVSNAL